MPSTVPSTAVMLEMRPPRRRNIRSSTVKYWHTCARTFKSSAAVSASVLPASRIRIAILTEMPSPSDAAIVSITRIFRSGYSSRSSRAASLATCMEPLMPDDMPMNRMS